ncbi:MAG: antibiotic biosynthesis monooxygenase [Armatimonadetes bacterium]|nr:antibiotic biosynthesis monooxygenase [Armatimonadota bacterium]
MDERGFQPVASCPLSEAREAVPEATAAQAGFVAINTIVCQPHYVERFECLFCSRARMIDKMPGFLGMNVLKCQDPVEPYLVVSFWETEQHFHAWVGSAEFHEGHKRAFADLREYKERGEQPPMSSTFKTYSVLSR